MAAHIKRYRLTRRAYFLNQCDAPTFVKGRIGKLALFTDTYAEKHIIALINHTQLMNLRDKMMIYIYRKGTGIEEEEKELKTSLRLSALDNLDHYEILLHRIRLQVFNEFVTDLYKIVINCK